MIRENKWDSEMLELIAAIYKEAGKQEMYLKRRPEERKQCRIISLRLILIGTRERCLLHLRLMKRRMRLIGYVKTIVV